MLFSQVVGQDRIKQKLIKTIRTGKVSNTQLFLAPEGAGGLPMALAFAQYLTCENPDSNDACGRCDACNKVQKLIHPDIHFTFPVVNKPNKDPLSDEFIKEWRQALLDNPYMNFYDWLQQIQAGNSQGNITVDDCREVIKKLSLKPFEGGKKIMILWMPERLGKEGNALLKILEEPSPDTYFILVGENSELILNTILSRAQLVRIPPLDAREMSEALREQLSVNESEAQEVAQLADGNFRAAMSLAKSGESEFSTQFIQWMRYCFRKNGLEFVQWTNQMAARGREEQKNFLSYALQMLEELFLLGEGMTEGRRLKADDMEFAEKFAGYVDEEAFMHIYDAINKAYYYIERNASSKIVFFNLSLQINRSLMKRKVLN